MFLTAPNGRATFLHRQDFVVTEKERADVLFLYSFQEAISHESFDEENGFLKGPTHVPDNLFSLAETNLVCKPTSLTRTLVIIDDSNIDTNK